MKITTNLINTSIKITKKYFLFVSGIFVISAVLLSSCQTSIFDRRISEGEMTFDVTYPEMDADDIMADFMPNTMNLKFKNNQFITEVSAGMGIFKTFFYSNSNTHVFKHLLKLATKKYVAVYNQENISVINGDYFDFNLIPMAETEIIAGYKCKKVLVIFNHVRHNSFYLYYTNEIKIEDPNWSIPFADIDGVMLGYRMERNNIVMEFRATEVKKAKIDDITFVTPSNYKEVSHEELTEEMNTIIETFNY